MALFQKYLSVIDAVECKLFRTSSRSDFTLKGVTLGQTISNAKVTKFNNDNVIFSSTESLKGNFKLICQDVEFHAPTITEATIGTNTDVTIIGFNIAKKTAYVTTLDIYHSKANKTLSNDLVGTCTKAILLHGGVNPTVAIPGAENMIVSLQPVPELLINYQSYEFFAEGLVAGAIITVFPYTSTKAAFVSNYQQATAVAGDAIYPEGSFYDATIKSESNIQPDATTEAKVIGLVRTNDLSPVSPEEYDSVTDLYRYSILAQLGEVSEDPSNPTIADRYLSLIALSDLVDPTVASTKSKKAAAPTNVLTHLKKLLQNSTSIVKAKVISQSQIADSVKVPSVSKAPLQKFLTQLSLRNSDFNTEDYKSRANSENYQVDTVHNAVIIQLDEEVGIFAQVAPNLYAIIRPSACSVNTVTTKGKKATTTTTALPFSSVSDKCKIGDLISFKLKTEPNVQNDMTFLHAALVHPELNATGIDAETKTEYDLNLELISSYTKGAKYNPARQYTIGQCVNNARVIKLREDRYIVGLPGNALAEINFSEIKDEMDAKFNPLTHFAPGDIIPRVVVLSMKKQNDEKQIYVCSARSSRADLISPTPATESSTAIRFSLEQFAVKNGCQFDHETESKVASLTKPTDLLVASQLQRLVKVSGVVSAVGEHGTFVQLSGVLSAVIDREALPRFKSLTIGQVQSFIVKFVTPDGGVVLTDKVSTKPTMSDNAEDTQLFDSLQRGMVIKGVVHSTTDHGVFVTLQDSTSLTALAYKTHCVDDIHDDWRKLFKVGQKTKAVITRIDRTERQISLSLKQSAISAAEKQQVVKTKEQLAKDASDQTTQQLLQAQAHLEKEQKALQITAAKEQKVLSTLFDPLAAVNKKSKKDKNADDEEELIDFDVDSGLTSQLQQMNKSGQMSDKDATERRIEMLEHVLVGLGDNTVTAGSFSIENASVQQFELKCASQPNNASFWISFMAFHLENNEVTKARDVVQRALKMMSVSSLASRWSMFSSLLSLEILYGTPTSLETAIAQAIKEFEKIKVYNEVGRIAITSAKYRIAIDYYVKSLRSSGLAQDKASNTNKPRHLLQSVQDIYISLISLHFAQQNRAECNSFLKQAITQLPSQYSSFIMIKTILLEFQSDHGSTVQGRTMFQTFLKDNVKRLDVWTTWIQQEIKVCKKLYQTIQLNSNTVTQAKKTEFKQQKTRVRELFDIFTTKAVNQYNISWSTFKPTQVKSIYALAIEFENSPVCNNDSRSDTIKQRASIYVEEISSSKQ